MKPPLVIVIVNWNAKELLQACLHSIEQTQQDSFKLEKVVVVDNASLENPLSNIQDFSCPISLITNNQNLGFGRACNQGAKLTRSDYILFLNPDTRLNSDSLEKAVKYLQNPQHQTIGILGIQLRDDENQIVRSCARLPSLKNFIFQSLGLTSLCPKYFPGLAMLDWHHKSNREVDHVIGAFYLVRTKIFEKLNGFDERFFVYLEDLDFSYRAKKLNWKIYYLADAQAYHKGGGVSEKAKPQRLYYSLESRILYAYKHLECFQGICVMLSTLLIEPWIRIVFAITKFSKKQIIETLKGYQLFYQSLPKIFKKLKR